MRIGCELRESGGEFAGVILVEGRAASGGRAEVFAPLSVVWPDGGIRITDGHGGDHLADAAPRRGEAGRIEVRTEATGAIRAAVEAGRRWMSVEFHSLRERTTRGGVREILRALVDAAALTDAPEYDATAAEVRGARRRRAWL